MLRQIMTIALAIPLAACISFGEDPPETLMTLTATSAPAAGAALNGAAGGGVAVWTPSVPQSLATQRVMVRASETGIAYLKDALWVEAPNRLFRTLLAETIQARTGRIVPDARNFSLAPDTRLSGRLSEFGLEAASRNVIVTYDATLTRSGSEQVQSRRFSATAPAASENGPAVAAALNIAANQVAVEVADWVGK